MSDPTPTTAPQRATAREFLAVLFRRRWIIIGLFAVTFGTVLAVVATTPLVYISSGAVLVRRGEQTSAMEPLRQVPNDWEIELGSEVQTAKSWPVLQLAQKFLDGEAGAPRVRVVEDRVDAEVTGKTNVLAIAYVDRDPRVAERVCDALLRAYIQFRQGSQLTYPKPFFDAEIRQADRQLETWMERRRTFANRTGIVDIAHQRSDLLFLRTQLLARRADAASALATAQSQLRAMAALERDPDVDMPTLVQVVGNEQSIYKIKDAITDQQARIAQLRGSYRDDAPGIADAQVTLDTLRAMLRREVAARMVVARSRVEVLRASVAAEDREIAAVDQRLTAMPDHERQVSEMDNQINVWRQRYLDLTKSSDQARINENTTPLISVFLLNPASPARPQNSRDYVRLGLAPAFSLVIGIGLAFFVDGLDLTVHTAGQAEEETRLPVLAAIPERRRGAWRPGARQPEKKPA